jgi:NAD(P)-dependent dehydrogenase (short-subunit alcohol dehydrogenase family)
MKILPGQSVLVTGAQGGLGTFITHALAECGDKLAMTTYPLGIRFCGKALAYFECARCFAVSCGISFKHLYMRIDGDL